MLEGTRKTPLAEFVTAPHHFCVIPVAATVFALLSARVNAAGCRLGLAARGAESLQACAPSAGGFAWHD